MLMNILAFLLIGCLVVMVIAGLSTVGRCFAIWIFRAKIDWIGRWEIVAGWCSLVFASILLPICFLASGRASGSKGSGVVYFSQDPFSFVVYVLGASIPAVALIVTTIKLLIWFRQTPNPPET